MDAALVGLFPSRTFLGLGGGRGGGEGGGNSVQTDLMPSTFPCTVTFPALLQLRCLPQGCW